MDQPTVIYETVHGSHAYGLARTGSDLDLRGVIVGPRSWYLGWRPAPDQIELTPDHVRYELRRFIHLAAEANPALLEMLWTDESDHRVVTPAGARLLASRRLFLSRRVVDRFGRYALSQLKRIRSHRSWLLHPPSGPPTRAAFGLPERTLVPADQLMAAEVLLEAGDIAGADVSPNFVALLSREKRYKSAHTQWRQYQGWLANRNPARAALEAKHGYDTKHAMHLVRIQRMAFEILTTGAVSVRRADAEELLAVRDGAWTFDELEAESEELAARIEAAVPASALPAEPDMAALDELCVRLLSDAISGRPV